MNNQVVYCQRCGQANAASDQFCNQCGSRLPQGYPPQQPQVPTQQMYQPTQPLYQQQQSPPPMYQSPPPQPMYGPQQPPPRRGSGLGTCLIIFLLLAGLGICVVGAGILIGGWFL